MQRPTSNFQRPTSNGAKRPENRFDLEERLLDYAALVIRLTNRLPRTRAGNHIARQLLRSGTAPLPNHGEAQAAESREDFIHKMCLCLKELRESRRWIRLIERVPLVKNPGEALAPLNETEQLIRIFAKSIQTARSGLKSLSLKVGR
jgi:four helix bundle protein